MKADEISMEITIKYSDNYLGHNKVHEWTERSKKRRRMSDDDDAGPSVEVRARIDHSAHLQLRPKAASRVDRSREEWQNVLY